jgi:segregation and condensation protein A
MSYRIKLDVFEGPFDLLLFLIKKDEVDIYDIPILSIAEQYLEYIELMKMLDLEVAGEFIEMVAILMNIKARMLLPRPVGMTEEEYEDPRMELVERLIEYKRYKDAALQMSGYEDERRKLFPRKIFPQMVVTEEITDEEYLGDVTLFDLLLAFKTALNNMPKITKHEVKRIDVTIEQQSEMILSELQQKPVVLFQELMSRIPEKIVIVVTFIALLELIKKRLIVVRQSEVFDDIRIKAPEEAEPQATAG